MRRPSISLLAMGAALDAVVVCSVYLVVNVLLEIALEPRYTQFRAGRVALPILVITVLGAAVRYAFPRHHVLLRWGFLVLLVPVFWLLNPVGQLGFNDYIVYQRYLLAGLLVIAHGLLMVAMAMLYSRYWRVRLGASITSTLVMVLVLEGLSRLIFPQPAFDPRLPFYPNRSETRTITLRGFQEQSVLSTNRWGLRGDEPPDDWERYTTIVAVGGSTTMCRFQDDANTWTAHLQDILQETDPKVWVGNAGLEGHSTSGHVVVMREVVGKLKPDVVLFLVGTNDLAKSLVVDIDRLEATRAPIFFRSQLFRLGWSYWQLLSASGVPTGEAYQDFVPEPVDPSSLTPLPDDLRAMLPSLTAFEENINTLIDMGQEMGVEVMFLTQPALYADTPYWAQFSGSSYWLSDQQVVVSAATWWRMLDIFNQALLRICEERNVTCFDLGAAIPHNITFFGDNVHFTDAGTALVAQRVAAALGDDLLAANARD